MYGYINFGYLGLSAHEVSVLKSLFTISTELKEVYVLTRTTELDKAHLVLVNIDDQMAIKRWNKLARINRLATPITFSNKGKTIDGVVSLTLPIRVQKLIEALQDVIKKCTKFKNLKDTLKNEVPLRVLVVDDSYPLRKYMGQKLAELAEVTTRLSFAASGEEAMMKFKTRDFDIVFLDVMMEGVDGYRVCKTIKSKFNAYVVMLTSKKSPFDRVRGTMSGCDAYITKPPADQRLIEELRKSEEIKARNLNESGRTDHVVAY